MSSVNSQEVLGTFVRASGQVGALSASMAPEQQRANACHLSSPRLFPGPSNQLTGAISEVSMGTADAKGTEWCIVHAESLSPDVRTAVCHYSLPSEHSIQCNPRESVRLTAVA